MSSLQCAIETRDLVKLYGRKTAVDHLNLSVPTGSVFAFLGRNGSGKTSTIKMMLNMLDRNGGDISVLGMNPKKKDFDIKRRVGYVAQDQVMLDWMTVKQILWFCSGFYPTWDKALTDQLINDLELPLNEKLRNLSRGTQAKVALMLSMAFRPELLILDEPTAGLDVIVRRDFLEEVIDLIQQEGRTVFFSSHLVHEVERVADWVGIIDNGRMIACCEIEALKNQVKRLTLTFNDNIPPDIKLDGTINYKSIGRQAYITIREHSDQIIAQTKQYQPQTIQVEDLSLEDIFIALVGEGG